MREKVNLRFARSKGHRIKGRTDLALEDLGGPGAGDNRGCRPRGRIGQNFQPAPNLKLSPRTVIG